VGTWRNIGRELAARAALLTARQYSSLTFKGPGTNLTIGLPPGHVWHGGEVQTQTGAPFTPNIPTEEIYTLPHRERVQGTVRATRPLSYTGATIDRFQFTFDDGRVTDFSAEAGEPRLKELIATDEGTCRLGEVALVPDSSPISKSGVVLHNALFDENAASHLALGAAYRFCMKGAETMTNEEFASAGGNTSKDHVDFMIGSSEIDVDARTSDGLTTPLMRHGEWAFEV
jgi:aminopeptidase